jgi:hypothetical protein
VVKEEFSALTLTEKVKVLYLQGSFVVGIRYYSYKVNLYLLGKDFIEVFYNHKLDQIERVDFLERNHTRMKFYLDQIKID